MFSQVVLTCVLTSRRPYFPLLLVWSDQKVQKPNQSYFSVVLDTEFI